MTLLLVTIFGAIGSVVRYLVEYAVRRHHPTIRPWGTAGVNVVGCLIAGWIVYRLASPLDAHWHAILLSGFCGGLTTFSSAIAIPAILYREHHWRYAVSLVVITPLLCGLAFALGAVIAR
jgi:CrcB protein